jgi:hypothetical protein
MGLRYLPVPRGPRPCSDDEWHTAVPDNGEIAMEPSDLADTGIKTGPAGIGNRLE